MLKCLRIAVTALCLTACVLLVALWVRSYFLADHFQLRIDGVRAGMLSAKACLGMWMATNEDQDRTFWHALKHEHVHDSESFSATTFTTMPVGSDSGREPRHALGLRAPHWFLLILSLAIAFLPWMQLKFSLRTLLIGMTLVAVGLGLVVALS